jgi:predicted alpha/beta superfamily hydrolase
MSESSTPLELIKATIAKIKDMKFKAFIAAYAKSLENEYEIIYADSDSIFLRPKNQSTCNDNEIPDLVDANEHINKTIKRQRQDDYNEELNETKKLKVN